MESFTAGASREIIRPGGESTESQNLGKGFNKRQRRRDARCPRGIINSRDDQGRYVEQDRERRNARRRSSAPPPPGTSSPADSWPSSCSSRVPRTNCQRKWQAYLGQSAILVLPPFEGGISRNSRRITFPREQSTRLSSTANNFPLISANPARPTRNPLADQQVL